MLAAVLACIISRCELSAPAQSVDLAGKEIKFDSKWYWFGSDYGEFYAEIQQDKNFLSVKTYSNNPAYCESISCKKIPVKKIKGAAKREIELNDVAVAYKEEDSNDNPSYLLFKYFEYSFVMIRVYYHSEYGTYCSQEFKLWPISDEQTEEYLNAQKNSSLQKSIPPLERDLKVTNPNRMHGDDVQRIQNHLLFLGYSEVGEADGYYGPKSASAVKRFQQDNGLEQTGVVDEETYDRLFE